MANLKGYNENYTLCRAIGHAWMIDERTKKRKGGIGTYVVIFGCGRCNMTRIDSYNYKGELLTRTYRQPEDYKLSFKPSMVDLRKMLFTKPEKKEKVRAQGK